MQKAMRYFLRAGKFSLLRNAMGSYTYFTASNNTSYTIKLTVGIEVTNLRNLQ